jgi:hypothetical protein
MVLQLGSNSQAEKGEMIMFSCRQIFFFPSKKRQEHCPFIKVDGSFLDFTVWLGRVLIASKKWGKSTLVWYHAPLKFFVPTLLYALFAPIFLSRYHCQNPMPLNLAIKFYNRIIYSSHICMQWKYLAKWRLDKKNLFCNPFTTFCDCEV